MKAPAPLQLRADEAPGLKPGALLALNTYLRQAQQGLSGRLTLSENHAATIKALQVSTLDPWQAPSFLNSWVDFGGSTKTRFTKSHGGVVTLELTAKSGTLNQNAFVLPLAYRPGFDLTAPAFTDTGLGKLVITAGGGVLPVSGGTSVFAAVVAYSANDLSAVSNLAAPITFAHGLSGRCTDLLLTFCEDARTGGQDLLAAPGAPRWYDDGEGNVVVLDLPSLYGPATFNVRLLCLGEPA